MLKSLTFSKNSYIIGLRNLRTIWASSSNEFLKYSVYYTFAHLKRPILTYKIFLYDDLHPWKFKKPVLGHVHFYCVVSTDVE
tara:strand:- start:518 stop:763 length:246 start_codon:yes stop_codon:yes gene_type:complete